MNFSVSNFNKNAFFTIVDRLKEADVVSYTELPQGNRRTRKSDPNVPDGKLFIGQPRDTVYPEVFADHEKALEILGSRFSGPMTTALLKTLDRSDNPHGVADGIVDFEELDTLRENWSPEIARRVITNFEKEFRTMAKEMLRVSSKHLVYKTAYDLGFHGRHPSFSVNLLIGLKNFVTDRTDLQASYGSIQKIPAGKEHLMYKLDPKQVDSLIRLEWIRTFFS